ncbi:uncharacterized protein LOC143039073 [Oratosquilla oratoria]|uniref:uncharacterized protein LOC143039073 n=1 Tax=Oratosquilla oratoria TaxID=337810 RepID=UPI003F76C6BC
MQPRHFVTGKESSLEEPTKVLIPTDEYLSMLDGILADETKFQRLTRDPTLTTVRKANKIIDAVNAPDYCYRSSTEFLDCVNSAPAEEGMASLDAESLFTCVPESAFRCPRENLYQQKDEVFMGSPLGVLFANFLMGSVEKEVFSRTQKPMAYGRYVDDIFVRTQASEEREGLRQLLQEISGLRFTTEEADNGTLPLLDVLFTEYGDRMKTEVISSLPIPDYA